MVVMHMVAVHRGKVLKRKRGNAKPRKAVRACVVLVGVQFTSVQRTEIFLSTLNVPQQPDIPDHHRAVTQCIVLVIFSLRQEVLTT